MYFSRISWIAVTCFTIGLDCTLPTPGSVFHIPPHPPPPQGYLPADPSSGLSSEERHFLERQLQAAEDEDDDEVDEAYDAFLEELDHRH